MIDSFINKKIHAENPVKKSVVKKDSSQKKIVTNFPKDTSVKIIRDTSKPVVTDSAKSSTDSNQIVVADSLKKDSTENLIAIIPSSQIKKLSWKKDTAFTNLFKLSFANVATAPVYRINEERKVQQKDVLFYTIIGIILFLAIIKQSFPKYFQNIFRWFFQASYRQNQSHESLVYDRLASLLFNFLFIISGGLFISLLADQYKFISVSFWKIFLYSAAILAAIYLFKFLFLKFTGLIFRLNKAADSYIFIVFLVNKIAGIILIPFLFLMAFEQTETINIVITVATCLFVLLLLYRYLMMLSYVRANLKVSAFHFFIYLCVVEIIPMIIIYKVFFNKIGSYI
ncbi:MAG: DUF4271 domain-containing protein [Chitinophagaceae bacterium]